MAYKLLNKRNDGIKLTECSDQLCADIEAIQQGEYTICPHMEDVVNLKNCFSKEDTDLWRVEELSHGMYGVLPNHTTAFQKREFAELLEE